MRRPVKRLALLCLIAPALAFVTASPAEAAFDCYDVTHTSDTYRTTGDGADFVRYRSSLRIRNQHCTSPTTYFDDIKSLRVMGQIVEGEPECNGDVIGGWSKYTANVGSIRGFNPSEVEWNCTSSTTWSMTWHFPSNDNLYVGQGSDRCVGAHMRWVRPIFNDMSDDIPAVCF